MRTIAVATALTAVLTTTPAATADTLDLHLPNPTGHQPVGTTSLYMKDTSRPDPWVPTVPYRELMVSLFYPTASADGLKKQYMTPAESEAYLSRENIPGLPPDAFSTVQTYSLVDAKPVGKRHSLPLIVLSPGNTQPRATLTSWAEDLASHGYVVAVIDHTYENRAQTFPDGRMTGCAACEQDDDQDAFFQKQVPSRTKDVSFVLDQLTGRHPVWRYANLIDPQRIGMTGHSAGGATTTHTMVNDPRIKAGIDVDGSIHVNLTAPGLNRPFMFLGSMDEYTPGAQGPYDDWEKDWPLMTGWKRWLMVSGSAHASYTDLGVLADQVGVDIGATMPGERAVAITRAYVRAFFDQHLRCRPQPLLNRPSSAYPEVTFIG
jgi:dienelactone hydrolase